MAHLTSSALCLLGILISSSFLGANARQCNSGWLKSDRYCYAYFDEQMTWAEAETECQNYGSKTHLASILTKQETFLIAKHISEHMDKPSDVWIGLHDVNDRGRWRWVDEAVSSWRSWKANEPDKQNRDKYCVELSKTTASLSFWEQLRNLYTSTHSTPKQKVIDIAVDSLLRVHGEPPTSQLIQPAEGQNCDKGWLHNGRNCFSYFDERVTWYDAEVECQSYGKQGNLASILSEEETNLLAEYIVKHQKVPRHVWIGLHKNKKWIWSNGAIYRYKAWMRNKPQYINKLELCAELHSSTRLKKWNNAPCEKRNAYICRLPAVGGISESSERQSTYTIQTLLSEDQLANRNGIGYNTDALPTSQANTCPWEWLKYNDNCYGFFRQKVSWPKAEMECQSYGNKTHLASILNKPEMLIVSKYISDFKREAGMDVWIGLHDPYENGKWRWIDESLFKYKNWMQGRPYKLWQSRHCVTLRARTGYKRWNNDVCKRAKAYLCKYGL